MRARACWVYGQFGKFPVTSDDHLRHALNDIFANLSHQDLPVRVNAAIALIQMLHHQIAIEFIRPGLGQVIKIYLKMMDEIDYDELVDALKTIVETFDDEIGPYAIELTEKLSEAYLRLF